MNAAAVCEFLGAAELSIVDGECVEEVLNTGWCMAKVAGNDTPDAWFEVETGRVMAFPLAPAFAPDGWRDCGDDSVGPVAPACACFTDTLTPSTTSTSG